MEPIKNITSNKENATKKVDFHLAKWAACLVSLVCKNVRLIFSQKSDIFKFVFAIILVELFYRNHRFKFLANIIFIKRHTKCIALDFFKTLTTFGRDHTVVYYLFNNSIECLVTIYWQLIR